MGPLPALSLSLSSPCCAYTPCLLVTAHPLEALDLGEEKKLQLGELGEWERKGAQGPAAATFP